MGDAALCSPSLCYPEHARGKNTEQWLDTQCDLVGSAADPGGPWGPGPPLPPRFIQNNAVFRQL